MWIFLTAILHRGLRNWVFYPFSIWTFVSLFLEFSFPFLFGLFVIFFSILFQFFFILSRTFWLSSNFVCKLYICTDLFLERSSHGFYLFLKKLYVVYLAQRIQKPFLKLQFLSLVKRFVILYLRSSSNEGVFVFK